MSIGLLPTHSIVHTLRQNIRTRNFNRLAPASHRKALTGCYCEIRKRLALTAQALFDLLPAQEALYCDGNELP
jgi:hypothetical protein